MSQEAEPVSEATVDTVKRTRGLSEGAAMSVLFAAAVACALTLFFIPRALPPLELPGLRLPEAEVAKQLQKDALAEQDASRDAAALEVERLYLEHGQAEYDANEEQREQRTRALHEAFRKLVRSLGEDAAVALRARAVAKLEAALDMRLPQEQMPGVLGTFPMALRAHQATRDGEEIVPHFVIRTLYKTRWNRSMGEVSDFAFSAIEKRALYGFLALHAENLSPAVRKDALDPYVATGGRDAAEAHAVLLFRERDFRGAAEAMQYAAARARHHLRIRNLLRGARVAAGLRADSEAAATVGAEDTVGLAWHRAARFP